ncbi:hypothetical protein DBR42_27350, partial [Pelomonas sp. HMWF004]
GHGSAQALAQLQASELCAADVLVTALGVNDIVGQVSPQQVLAALDAIAAQARQRAGVRLSLHCAAPPMHAFPLLPQPLRWFFGRQAAHLNRALHGAMAGQPARQVAVLPEAMQRDAAALMAPDGFHPGPRGYALWAEALADQIVICLGLPLRSMAT